MGKATGLTLIYAGVGSRQTPPDVLVKMRSIARILAIHGFTLRSGKADGADTAFELGCDDVNGKKEIWVPWKGFNHAKGEQFLPLDEHYEIASQVHPAWPHLTKGPRSLHARNVGQVLGQDLHTPVLFVLCWTQDGARTVQEVTRKTGGTGMAIKIAAMNGVPVINMYHPDYMQDLKRLIKVALEGV